MKRQVGRIGEEEIASWLCYCRLKGVCLAEHIQARKMHEQQFAAKEVKLSFKSGHRAGDARELVLWKPRLPDAL